MTSVSHWLDAAAAAAVVRGPLPMPNPTPAAPPGVGGKVNTALGYLMWAGGIVCFVSIATIATIFFFNAIGMMRGGAEEIVGRLGWVFLGAGILGGASGIGYALTGV